MVSGDGEHVYQETPSAYTWIGKVHSPSTVQFWSREKNSKMAAVCCCFHVVEKEEPISAGYCM
jgi:hypothetical protein